MQQHQISLHQLHFTEKLCDRHITSGEKHIEKDMTWRCCMDNPKEDVGMSGSHNFPCHIVPILPFIKGAVSPCHLPPHKAPN